MIRALPTSDFAALVRRARGSLLVQRLVSGSAWVLVGSVSLRVLNLITFVILARTLGDAGLGRFAMVQSTVALFIPISTGSVNWALAKYVAQYRQADPERTAALVVAGLLVCVSCAALLACVGLLGSGPLSSLLFGSREMSALVQIASLALVGSSLNAVLESVLNGFERFAAGAAVKFLRGLSALFLITAGSRMGGHTGALFGLVGAEFVMVAAYIVALWTARGRHARRPHLHVVRAIAQYGGLLLAFSGPLLVGWLAVSPAFWLSKRLLAGMPQGYAAVGVFGAAEKWYQMALFVPSSLSLFALPALSNTLASRGSVAHRRLFILTSSLSIGVAAAIAAVVWVLSGAVTSILGSGFAGAQTTLKILLVTSLGAAANTTFGHYFVSKGQVTVRMACDVLLGLLVVACSLLLVPLYRENGVALTQLASYSCTAVVLGVGIWLDIARGGSEASARRGAAPRPARRT